MDVLTSADIQEIVRTGGKLVEFNESVINRENFTISSFRNLIDR